MWHGIVKAKVEYTVYLLSWHIDLKHRMKIKGMKNPLFLAGGSCSPPFVKPHSLDRMITENIRNH